MSIKSALVKSMIAFAMVAFASTTSIAQEDSFDDFSFDEPAADTAEASEGEFEDFGEFEDIDSMDDQDFAEDFQPEATAEAAPEVPAEPTVEPEPAIESESLVAEPEEAAPIEAPQDPPVLEALPGEEPAGPRFDENFFAEEPAAEVPLTSGSAGDEPNLELEAKLHDIYMRFHNQATSEAEWNSIAAGRASERYVIQSGDNLWSISKTFFGDGNYWPKIWSLNSEITNPHLIRPGNNIRFLLGDESQPPAFTVTEATPDEDAEQPATEGEPMELAEGSTENEPEIPPPAIRSRPVIKNIPPSLPQWQDLSATGNYDELGIDYGKRKIVDILDKIPLAGYISEEPILELGKVSEVEVGSRIASALQYVYVTMNDGQAQVGDSFLSVRNLGPVESAHPSIQGFLGYSVEVQGELQLVEKVASADDTQKVETFRALVTQIVNPVSIGSSLIEGSIESIQLTESGPRSQTVAQIIGGQYFNKRQVYGTESIAFLNRGSKDGLARGQLLSVRENRKIRNPDTAVKENVRPIGWLKIVRTTPSFATAIVLRSWSDILTGDLTGAGAYVENLRSDLQPEAAENEDTAENELLDELDE